MNFVLAAVLLIIVIFQIGVVTTSIDIVVEDSPAAYAGINQGDKIVAINEKEVSTWNDVIVEITASKGSTIDVVVERDSTTLDFTITPEFSETDNRYMVGISPLRERKFFPSIYQGIAETGNITKMIFEFIPTLFTDKESLKDVVGPVGMISLVDEASDYGYLGLFNLAALISINLGIMNLLPFPALDGGRIIFILIALVIRRPIDDRIEEMVHTVGFVLLLALMMIVMYRDIIKLFTN